MTPLSACGTLERTRYAALPAELRAPLPPVKLTKDPAADLVAYEVALQARDARLAAIIARDDELRGR